MQSRVAMLLLSWVVADMWGETYARVSLDKGQPASNVKAGGPREDTSGRAHGQARQLEREWHRYVRGHKRTRRLIVGTSIANQQGR